MEKIKIKSGKNQKKIIFCGKGDGTLKENQIELINLKPREAHLLPIESKKRGKSYTLMYDITNFMQLGEFLKMPMDRDTFAQLLKNILDVSEELEKTGLQESGVLFDVQYVVINPSKKKLYFIYIPDKKYKSSMDKKHLLVQFASQVIHDEENIEYAKQLIKILKEESYLSPCKLKEYVAKLLNKDDFSQKIKKCGKCHAIINEGDRTCPHCGCRIEESSHNMAVYQPNASSENRMEPDTPPTTLAGGEVFEELTARHEQEEVKLHIYIIRKSNGNKVYIDKDSFLIGRSSACDYVISDKPDISRKHATIIKEKNECYIRDEESSFGTFVDGRKLEANVKTKIGPGELIRLSGEEFKISYEEE